MKHEETSSTRDVIKDGSNRQDYVGSCKSPFNVVYRLHLSPVVALIKKPWSDRRCSSMEFSAPSKIPRWVLSVSGNCLLISSRVSSFRFCPYLERKMIQKIPLKFCKISCHAKAASNSACVNLTDTSYQYARGRSGRCLHLFPFIKNRFPCLSRIRVYLFPWMRCVYV